MPNNKMEYMGITYDMYRTLQGLEEELGNEFDNLTDEESSQSSEDDAADDGTFGKFLKGIVNPKEEFPEDESMQDVGFYLI
jgi:hypothetical protein